MNRLSIYLAMLVFFTACNSAPEVKKVTNDSANENTVILDSQQLMNAGVVSEVPQVQNVHSTIKVNGTVDVPPQSLVSVSFPLGGYLKSTALLPGYPVHKGQVIATMEDQSYVQLQQDYLTAKARMEYLSADVERQKELSDADATSKKNYQLVLSDYKTQQAIIRSLEEKLRIININPQTLTVNNISRMVSVYSPINGYVTQVNVNIGKYVNPADIMFELVNPDDIHAAITVFEKDLTSFKKGMKGKVALTDKPDEFFDVEVILVTKNIDESRAGLVHCHFENPKHELLPGMFLTGVFEMDGKAATVVPEDAVVRYMGKQYVFIAKNENKFILTEIETGVMENGMVEIKQKENIDLLQTKVVIKGAYALLGKLKNKMEEE
ncbi:efflux RND transporter periplasmic adaptor subunit [Panacibacter ginsenosidivorans]|uniref:Efflux RND transporter periplasmic adaptor subunit n=1 Tax=Panacibacter ginsenosidivorans TaxID=1813871 RepID=A0A5B8VEI8_9BACT|nr:efflux RND transporter periplasmic adaptor subunit [Panacibacter ginsenosidivorans]QEC69937.1 efflux RND transporter periplasmic adaptor subunit [Panacibacter ginsenosidivorans]